MKFFAKWFSKTKQLNVQAVPPVFLCLTGGLQARGQFASTRRSCDRPNGSRISVIFLATTAKAQLAAKLHFVLFLKQRSKLYIFLQNSALTAHSKFDALFLWALQNSSQIL
jgi:hypothetical protein